MYTLVVGKSRSPNYQRAIKWIEIMGGKKEGDDWVLIFKEEIKAYRALFPLFRLHVMEWKNTRAYHNGKSVNPYTFVFRQHLKRNTFFAQILEQISPDINLKSLLSEDPDPEPFLFHKREENRFYFRGIDHAFFLDLKGRMLYEFVDRFDIGDIVYFE